MGYLTPLKIIVGMLFLLILTFLILFTSSSTYGQNTSDKKDGYRIVAMGEKITDKVGEREMLNIIREATLRFHDVREAEKAGYRPFGPDMPNMGRHWVNTRMALGREFNLKKPSTLTYLDIQGELKLTGVAYTTAVQPGETPLALPHPDMQWHFHAGHLEDEAHGIHRSGKHGNPINRARLGMVHAWVWEKNPEGIFAPDNWALSFLRHSLDPPENIDPATSNALFLASGHSDYFIRFIELCLEPDHIDKSGLKSILKRYVVQIKTVLSEIKPNSKVSQQNQDRIAGIWDDMWKEIKKGYGDEAWSKISPHLPSHAVSK